MRPSLPPLAFSLLLVALPALAFAVSCSEDDTNPVGTGNLPVVGDTIQEITLEPVQAERFLTGTSDRAFGTLLTAAHDSPTPDGFESRILVRFNLTIRDTTVGPVAVDSAQVRLNLFDLDPDSVRFSVFRVTESWIEEEVSWEDRAFDVPWSAPGAAFDPTPLAQGVLAGDSLTLNLPDTLVQGWVDQPDANQGLLLLVETPAAAGRITAATTLTGTTEAGPRLRLFLTVNDSSSVSDVTATADAFITTYEGAILPGLAAGNEPFLRSLLRFDLSALPAEASINLAELRLTPRQVVSLDSLQLQLRRVVSPFRGGGTVFSTAVLDTTLLGEVRADSTIVFNDPDLATLVRLWQADSTLNLGLGLQAQRRFGNLGFTVLNDPTGPPETRPRLRVIFTPPLSSDLPRGGP